MRTPVGLVGVRAIRARRTFTRARGTLFVAADEPSVLHARACTPDGTAGMTVWPRDPFSHDGQSSGSATTVIRSRAGMPTPHSLPGIPRTFEGCGLAPLSQVC